MIVNIDRLLEELSDETRTLSIARLYDLSGLDHEESSCARRPSKGCGKTRTSN